MNGFVCVQTFLGRMEAEGARLALEASGIPVIVLADDAGGIRPELSMQKGVRLMVRDKDEEEAREILSEDHTEAVQESEEISEHPAEETSEQKSGILSRLRRWLSGS